jgi:hypothetical protein
MSANPYNDLGWVLFTFGLLIFIYWAYQVNTSPTGSIQTFVWTVGGAILLYLIAGIYTFTGVRIVPQSDATSITNTHTKPLTYYDSSSMGGLMS